MFIGNKQTNKYTDKQSIEIDNIDRFGLEGWRTTELYWEAQNLEDS